MNQTMLHIEADEMLVKLLRGAEFDDLAALVSIVTDDGSGRLALPAVIRDVLIQAKDAQPFLEGELRLLVREI